MTRRKFYYLLSWLLSAIFVCVTVVCLLTMKECYFVCFAVVSVLVIWTDHMHTKEKDKDNPLSAVRISQALSFAVRKMHGTKEEFIAASSKEMYEYCLSNGYIHEFLFFGEDTEWEVTKVGRRVAVRLAD